MGAVGRSPSVSSASVGAGDDSDSPRSWASRSFHPGKVAALARDDKKIDAGPAQTNIGSSPSPRSNPPMRDAASRKNGSSFSSRNTSHDALASFGYFLLQSAPRVQDGQAKRVGPAQKHQGTVTGVEVTDARHMSREPPHAAGACLEHPREVAAAAQEHVETLLPRFGEGVDRRGRARCGGPSCNTSIF